MRSWLPFVLVFLAPAISRGQEPMANAEITLADIIKNVKQNEKLYRNIEVVMNTTYDIGGRTPTIESQVFRQKMRTRYVSQGEWFRVEREGTSTSSQRISSMDRIRSFDGETTRVLEQDAVGNISKERLEDENFIRPHMLLFRYTRKAVPFSVYLSGHEAIRTHPNGSLGKNLTMQVTYEGEEEFNDLKCHKVLVNKLLKSGEPHNGQMLWLAEDRNYLPIKELAYTYRFSKTVPVGQSVVKDLQEISPGIWFPFAGQTTSWNKFKIQREGKKELQWRERHVVESAKLDPQHDREFFEKVDFPKGTAMYEVEKGVIKRSWRQGEPKPE